MDDAAATGAANAEGRRVPPMVFGFDAPTAVAVIVLGALLVLILIRFGFRSIIPGAIIPD